MATGQFFNGNPLQRYDAYYMLSDLVRMPSLGATVSVIDSVFDSASGTFGVRLTLPNAKGDPPAGIRCQVDFPPLRGMPSRVRPAARAPGVK